MLPASILVAQIIGLVVAIAWFLPDTAQALLPDNWHLMTFSTSVSVVATGSALLGCHREQPNWLQRLFVVAVAIVLILVLTSTFNILNSELMQLPENPVGQLWRPMAIQTQLGFSLILGAAVAIKFRGRKKVVDLLILSSFLLKVFLTIGYLSVKPPMVGQTMLIRTAPHTLVALWLLWYGLLTLRIQGGSLSDYLGDCFDDEVKKRVRNLLDALHR